MLETPAIVCFKGETGGLYVLENGACLLFATMERARTEKLSWQCTWFLRDGDCGMCMGRCSCVIMLVYPIS